MKKRSSGMFWAIEINLIFWLLTLGSVISDQMNRSTTGVVVVGFLFAAGFQHWAYYNLKQKTPRPASQ